MTSCFFYRGFCLITGLELLCMTLMHVVFCNLLLYACRLQGLDYKFSGRYLEH